MCRRPPACGYSPAAREYPVNLKCERALLQNSTDVAARAVVKIHVTHNASNTMLQQSL